MITIAYRFHESYASEIFKLGRLKHRIQSCVSVPTFASETDTTIKGVEVDHTQLKDWLEPFGLFCPYSYQSTTNNGGIAISGSSDISVDFWLPYLFKCTTNVGILTSLLIHLQSNKKTELQKGIDIFIEIIFGSFVARAIFDLEKIKPPKLIFERAPKHRM